jgi:L-methionine (R)-S-oxide reductase
MKKEQKAGRYQRVYKQIVDLLTKTDNRISRMSTVVAVLHHKFDYYFWTGFYLLRDEDLLVGPYQGPLACQLLERNVGVCWAGVNQAQSIVVPDVHKFPGHIACSDSSNSEIVVPLFDENNSVIGVLDVDSKEFNSFDETDRIWLEKICELI